MKIGDLVKFANGNPKAKALGIVLPPAGDVEIEIQTCPDVVHLNLH